MRRGDGRAPSEGDARRAVRPDPARGGWAVPVLRATAGCVLPNKPARCYDEDSVGPRPARRPRRREVPSTRTPRTFSTVPPGRLHPARTGQNERVTRVIQGAWKHILEGLGPVGSISLCQACHSASPSSVLLGHRG